MPEQIGGYPLFNEVEDKELQLRNRAVSIANIIEDNLHKEGVITEQGMYLSLQYWDAIDEEERGELYKAVKVEVDARSLIPGGI